METKFKVGDKVWCLLNGEGVVDTLLGNGISYIEYPILVRFISGPLDYYTVDGKVDICNLNPSLFLSEPVVTVTKRKVKRETIKYSIGNPQEQVCFYNCKDDGEGWTEVTMTWEEEID